MGGVGTIHFLAPVLFNSGIFAFLLVHCGKELILPAIFLVMLLPFGQLPLYLDHLLLHEINELDMLVLLLLLFRVERLGFLFFEFLLQSFQLP